MSGARALASRLRRHRVGLALLLILAFGAFLRVSYALPQLNSKRFYDERFNFRNVRKVLHTWSFEPASPYYPSPLQTWPQALTVAASQWLYTEHGVESAQAVRGGKRFLPQAYLLVRMISVIYGTLTLALLYLVGRRLASPALGLLAALALAALPWHIHVSSKFKPDALLVLGVVLAFHCSLIAIERARVRDHVWAGLAVCLAMSAKVMGGLISLPLALGTLMMGWRDRRRLGLLALAAATSLTSFLILNPHARYYLDFVTHLQGDYAMRAEQQGMTRAGMPGELAAYLFGPYVHGPFFGTLALAGLLWLGVSLWRRPAPPSSRAQRAMLIFFPPVYAGAYVASTPYFKGNNVLPIVPFTTLAALWLLLEAWRWMLRRAPLVHGRSVQVLGAGVVIFLLASPGTLYVYRTLTPTTLDSAREFLLRGRGPAFGRILLSEAPLSTTAWELASPDQKRASTLVVLERLDGEPRQRLNRADGEVLLAGHLDRDASGFYSSRIERLADRRVKTIRPRLFELRGPPLVALRHPWRLATEPEAVELSPCPDEEQACFSGSLPETIAPGQLVSMLTSVEWKVLERNGPRPTLEVAGRRHPLLDVLEDKFQITSTTERFILGNGERTVRLSTDRPRRADAAVVVMVNRWRQRRAASPVRPDAEKGSG